MYLTTIASVEGGTVIDNQGKMLYASGNIPAVPGMRVWTDGVIVYGSNPTGGGFTIISGASGLLYSTVDIKGFVTIKILLPSGDIREVKTYDGIRLIDQSNGGSSEVVYLLAGEKNIYAFDYEKEQAINLKTLEAVSYASDAQGILTADVDDSGELILGTGRNIKVSGDVTVNHHIDMGASMSGNPTAFYLVDEDAQVKFNTVQYVLKEDDTLYVFGSEPYGDFKSTWEDIRLDKDITTRNTATCPIFGGYQAQKVPYILKREGHSWSVLDYSYRLYKNEGQTYTVYPYYSWSYPFLWQEDGMWYVLREVGYDTMGDVDLSKSSIIAGPLEKMPNNIYPNITTGERVGEPSWFVLRRLVYDEYGNMDLSEANVIDGPLEEQPNLYKYPREDTRYYQQEIFLHKCYPAYVPRFTENISLIERNLEEYLKIE